MTTKILVTGGAGFIGMHLIKSLLEHNFHVCGIYNFTDITYESSLKYDRLCSLGINKDEFLESKVYESDNFCFYRMDICDKDAVFNLISKGNFSYVVNLAALPGVRLSTLKSEEYIKTNVNGFFNILEAIRVLKHEERPFLLFASSSSVYGDCSIVPFKEDASDLHQVSVYAATKRMDEILAYTYGSLHHLKSIGLRFFTVYGPWGRPDMAPFIFTKALLSGKEIRLFNHGDLQRDFTYIDDIVSGIISIILQDDKQFSENFDVYNIGCGHPVKLMDFVRILEDVTGRKGKLIMERMQKGDVHQTYASTQKLEDDYGYIAKTPLKEGLAKFYSWYQHYYKV